MISYLFHSLESRANYIANHIQGQMTSWKHDSLIERTREQTQNTKYKSNHVDFYGLLIKYFLR